MSQRFTMATALLALALAAFVISRPSDAQATKEHKGVFSTLRVGQPVEVAAVYQNAEQSMASASYVFRTYENPEAKDRMAYKVMEIGESYIALQLSQTGNPGEVWDVRVPVHSVMAVFHVREVAKKPGAKASKKDAS
ncbi:MAG: hypothetical protein ACKV0T_03445 [Planctomycetales bacterium]